MSKLSDLKSLSSEFSPGVRTAPLERVKSAPVALMEFSDNYRKLSDENRSLKESQGAPMELALSEITENPLHSQIRRLNEDQVRTLMDNFRENPLASPVSVRRKGDHFELVAGRHRLEAYRRMGRTHIPAIVRLYDDEEASRALVLDNLITANLTDYERYCAINALRDQLGWSYTDLHEHTGLSRTLLSYLMQFGRLDKATHDALKENPKAITYTQLQELIALAPSESVLGETIRKIAAHQISHHAAVQQLRGRPAARRAHRQEFHTASKSRWATLRQKDRQIAIRIDPEHESRTGALLEAIEKLMGQWAEKS